MTLYAAYGTNLDPERMAEHCPHSPLQGTGWLTGWRMTFGGEDLGWDGALATIVQDPFEQVFVAVYDVTREDESALDGWESADSGLYRKTKVRVSTMTEALVAWTYVLDAFEGGLPSASYLGVLANAAEAASAPDDYVSAIRRPALPLDRALGPERLSRRRGGRPPRRCCRRGRGRSRRSRRRGTPARAAARAAPRRRGPARPRRTRARWPRRAR